MVDEGVMKMVEAIIKHHGEVDPVKQAVCSGIFDFCSEGGTRKANKSKKKKKKKKKAKEGL
jgi:hypothetical protein